MNKNKNSNKSPHRGNTQNVHSTKKRRRGKKSKNTHRDDQNMHNNIMNNAPNINNTFPKPITRANSTPINNNNIRDNNAPKLSYAARISSASSNPSKKASLRIRSGGSGREYEGSTSPRQSLHGNMSKEDLLRIRMQQRDICYVAGLPKSICTRNILGSKKWFGQFGKIRDITITDNQNCIRTNWMCVHIKYFENISALKAVQAMNHRKLDDGRVLEANYGTQRYCEFFINNKKCHKSNCPFRHSWCKLNEIVNFNNHHQIINNTNNIKLNTSMMIKSVNAPPSVSIRPQPQAVIAISTQISPTAISQQSLDNSNNTVHSVPSTSSTDLKQNDININIGSDKNEDNSNNMNMINADYNVSDHDDNEDNHNNDDEDHNDDDDDDEGQMHNIVHEQQMEMHELYEELQCIKEENKTHKILLIDLQNQLETKEAEILKLQKISRRLYDAHSRMKSENEALQKQNNELVQEINRNNTQSLDLLDYTLWQWHDVYEWIISIENGKFSKYKEVLKQSLELENIDGSCIKCLTTNDIHRIGIVDYKDKQLILECISNLKSNLGLDNLINDIMNSDNRIMNPNDNHIV